MIVECPACKRRYDASGRPRGSRARCRCGHAFTLPAPPDSAGTLRCPSCGAPAAPTATSCAWCTSHLAISACPRCFAQLFAGSRFCGACGAIVAAPATALANGQAAPRLCPRCKPGEVRLESQLTERAMLDGCPSCGGVFVDSDVLELLLAERRHDPETPTQPPADLRVAPAPARPMYIRCPDCDGHMLRHNFARRSGVIVDECRPHGVWFDAHELEQLVRFVRAGGLDGLGPRGGGLTSERSETGADRITAGMLAMGGREPDRTLKHEFLSFALDALARLAKD